MTFDRITSDDRLWAVKYEGKDDNVLAKLCEDWSDVKWLRQLF